MKPSTPEYFLSRVQITPGCWLWLDHTGSDGYGKLTYLQKTWRAHRLAYQLFVGDLVDGLLVCHTCDNPICVKPDHLFLGTPKKNTEDMWLKNRAGHRAIGKENIQAKLTVEQVREIRDKYESGGYTQYALAKMFGVSQTVVGDAIRRKTWKHVV